MITVAEFIKRPELRNAWCKWPNTVSGVYLRHASHILQNDVVARTLDISNLSVKDDKQNQGVFKSLLFGVATFMRDDHFIYVENVQTARFAAYFEKHGWLVAPIRGLGNTPCFYALAGYVRDNVR